MGAYEEAVAWLNRGTAYFGDMEDFTAKIEEYKSMYPVHLREMKPAAGENFATEEHKSDIYGNTFSKGLRVSMYQEKERYSEYVPNKLYKRFRTTILMEEGARDYTEFYVRIYADDLMVFETGVLTYKSEPITVDVGISGVTLLRIVVERVRGAGYVLFDDPVFAN